MSVYFAEFFLEGNGFLEAEKFGGFFVEFFFEFPDEFFSIKKLTVSFSLKSILN
jgi:hypothetical protein